MRSALLGVLWPQDVPEIDTASETDRLAGVENVPLEPSGNDSVCMSTEETAVVGFDCNEGRFAEVKEGDGRPIWRRDGLGGSGGRSPSS